MLRLFESLGRRTAPRVRAAGRRAKTFGRARQGGVALITAVVLPPLVLVSLGAIELNQVLADKRATQDVADAAALMGAQQLNVAPVGADSRAQAFAQTQLTQISARSTVTVTATILDSHTMKVAVDTQRQSFFGNLFPPGGFLTHAESTAASASVTPLCVLVVGPTWTTDIVHLKNTSTITASQCLVHSNFAVTVDAGASLAAYATEAGTTASGSITPAASTGAPPRQDPFSAVNVDFPSTCPTPPPAEVAVSTSMTLAAGASATGYNISSTGIQVTLQPGLHPGRIDISGGAIVTLAPGEHYFCQPLTLSGGGQLIGNDAVLDFEPTANVAFGPNTSVNLTGRKSGPLAGFVIIADRNYKNDFHIQSDPISNITGTVYVPNAQLVVDGSTKGAASSAWTVLASKAFTITGSTQLVINANYTGSDVPVPYGVGNKTAPARLTK